MEIESAAESPAQARQKGKGFVRPGETGRASAHKATECGEWRMVLPRREPRGAGWPGFRTQALTHYGL